MAKVKVRGKGSVYKMERGKSRGKCRKWQLRAEIDGEFEGDEGYVKTRVFHVNANIVSTDWANVPPRPRQPIPANRTNVLSPTAPTELCSPMALPHRDRSDYWMKGTSWAS